MIVERADTKRMIYSSSIRDHINTKCIGVVFYIVELFKH
jgi:hypothetical protein